MALSISNPEAERLATDLAELTGESRADAVTHALEERLARIKHAKKKDGMAARILEISERSGSLPVLDQRTPEEMLYDDRGLPK